MEIERKFLLGAFPELPVLEESVLYQGYLCTKPVVRIRSRKKADGTTYELCFKGEGTLVRQEIELPIEEKVFSDLAELIGKPLVRKDFKVFRLPGGEKLECSFVDAGTPWEFRYAEVEFPTVEAAIAFAPPEFLGREVTEEASFSMSSYWTKTRLNAEG